MKAFHNIVQGSSDASLVGAAGLVPALRLAERAGLHDLMGRHLTVDSPNAAVKAVGVIAGMLTGADSIDDLAVLRHGSLPRLLDGVRAPSTYGTFLRAFGVGHARQLQAVNTRLLAALSGVLDALLPTGGVSMIDIDDTLREVHGYRKQGAEVTYTKQRGLNIQLATLSGEQVMPLILAARLRRGKSPSFTGGPLMVAEAINAARAAGVSGQIMIRADSGYHGRPMVATALRHGVWFSITLRHNEVVNRAISRIPEDQWTPIKYPNAVYDEQDKVWISDAEVAEVTDFDSLTHGGKPAIRSRLVVRRVKRLNPDSQEALLDAWRYHAFMTNSDLDKLEADRRHRDHAIIEQVIAELKSMALAHLPSGRFGANAAWVGHAVIGFNLAKAVAAAAGHPKTRWTTIARQLINIPARVTSSARRLRLHLPTGWPWNPHLDTLWQAALGPPTPAST